MSSAAPPPVRKPGRIAVYSAVTNYDAASPDELSFAEGDLLYVQEDTSNSGVLKARTGKKEGVIPRTLVNEETLTLVEHPLHEAAKRGNVDLVDEYLSNNISPNSLDRSGATPLYWASFGGHLNVVQRLLAIPHICATSQNKLGDTVIHGAARKGQHHCIQILIESGMVDKVLHCRNNEGKTALDVASTPETEAVLQVAMRKIAEPAAVEEYLSSDED